MFISIAALPRGETELWHVDTKSTTEAMAFLLSLPMSLSRMRVVCNTMVNGEARMLDREAWDTACIGLYRDTMDWLDAHYEYGEESC